MGSSPRVECCRVGLSVWIRKLVDVSANGSESGAPTPSADEAMLEWVVLYVRYGWTPKEVMVLFFPPFGDMLFQMISDNVEEG